MAIRAGLLREFITIRRQVDKYTDSGQLVKEKQEVATVRARVLKQSGNLKEKNNELFNSIQIVFQIRFREDIQINDEIEYRGMRFKISFFDFDLYDDRSLKITAELINE